MSRHVIFIFAIAFSIGILLSAIISIIYIHYICLTIFLLLSVYPFLKTKKDIVTICFVGFLGLLRVIVSIYFPAPGRVDEDLFLNKQIELRAEVVSVEQKNILVL